MKVYRQIFKSKIAQYSQSIYYRRAFFLINYYNNLNYINSKYVSQRTQPKSLFNLHCGKISTLSTQAITSFKNCAYLFWLNVFSIIKSKFNSFYSSFDMHQSGWIPYYKHYIFVFFLFWMLWIDSVHYTMPQV